MLGKILIKLKLAPVVALRRIQSAHKRHVLAKFSKTDPVFILGVQKSGTTAIAALLADATGQPATLDITPSISRPASKILRKY